MASIPILPPNHFPVGSAAYNNNTHKFIANQEANGSISGPQAGILARQQHRIHAQRQQDLALGVSPWQDPTLKREQVVHRATADGFANFGG